MDNDKRHPQLQSNGFTWKTWNREFIFRADAAHLWHEKISPNNVDEAGNSLLKPFTERPVAPDPTKYDKRDMPGQDPGTLGIDTTPEGIQAGSIIDLEGRPNNAYEMTVSSSAAYASDLMAFNACLAMYQYEDQAHQELKDWVLNTTEAYLVETTASLVKLLRYNALRQDRPTGNPVVVNHEAINA